MKRSGIWGKDCDSKSLFEKTNLRDYIVMVCCVATAGAAAVDSRTIEILLEGSTHSYL